MSTLQERLYTPLMLATAALLVVCGFTLTILMLGKIIGPFRFASLSRTQAERSFGLWTPAYTGRSALSEARLRAWRRVAPEDRPLVESSSLSDLVGRGVGILAVPDARNLGARELRELRGYLASGGGALLTGSIGVVSSHGEWRGYAAMRSLLGVDRIRQLETEQSTSITATLRGPLSARLDPGQVIRLYPEPGLPTFDSPTAELRFAAGASSAEAWGPAADRRRDFGRGRLVWIAVGPENAQDGASETWHPMLRLLRNAVAWAARDANLEVLPWPDGAPLAGEILRGGGSANPGLDAAARDALLLEIERATHWGDLARLPIPESEHSGDLASFAASSLRERDAWLPEPDDLGSWLAIRSAMSSQLQRRGPRRLQVDVTNRGEVPARGVVLRIYINSPVAEAQAGTTTVMQRSAGIRIRAGAEAFDVVLPEIPSGQSRSYSVDYRLDSDVSENLQTASNEHEPAVQRAN